MNPNTIAEALGHHPTELALVLSLLASLTLTLAIVATERARPWLRAGFERRPKFLGPRSVAVFQRVDEALVLLILALLGILGGSSLFLHLVEGLRESTWLPEFDHTFVQTVHHTTNPTELAFFRAITPLAGPWPPLLLGLLVGIGLLWRRHRLLCAVWVTGIVGNTLLSAGLKQLFGRDRPVFENPFVNEPYFSFPSGHSMTSVLLYGLLAYICSRELFRYNPRHRHIMIWALTFLGVLIGTSRLVLGAHFPSDVLAGWSVASAWLATLVLLAETLRGRFGPVGELRAFLRHGPSAAALSEQEPLAR